MKTREVRYQDRTLTLIVDDDDAIEDLRLYVNNVEGHLRVMYMSDAGHQARLDTKLRGFSCRPKNGNNFDLRAENCEPRNRSREQRRKEA